MKKTWISLLAFGLAVSGLWGCSASSDTAAKTEAKTETESSVSAGEAADASWPSSSAVEIYVPFKAGGNSDLCARVFAEALTKDTGKNFVVVNQSEGGGAVCYNTVADAKADGSVLGWVTPSWFTNYFAGTHDLNPMDDFSTLAVTTALTSQYLIVPKDSPFDTLDDLVSYCKENPNTLVLGMQLGSASHYYAESCAQNLGITWNYVECGSDADRITAILGNTIEATTINGSAALDYVKAGEVKCLAALYSIGDHAPEELKDIPSLSDLGYEDIDVKNCNFLFAPKLDDGLAEQISAEFDKVFTSEEVQNKLKELNQEQEMTCEFPEIPDTMQTLYDSYHKIAESLNILAEGR